MGEIAALAPRILGLGVGGASPVLCFVAFKDCELALDNDGYPTRLRVVEEIQSGTYSRRREVCVQSGNLHFV